jgi:NADPH:quinone reductase-like Zn-dependent oxidoreductase
MRAIAIDRFGGPRVLKLRELPLPEPDANELLIRLHTAGVGPWDAEIREGAMDRPARFPLVLGTDGSGTVAQVGSRIRRFKTGEKVYSYSWDNPKGGFYAEYVAVPADRVAPCPRGISLEEAGAIATTGLTALQGVDDTLRVKKGEYVIVHGATGGVGSLALQFAKLHGAHVLATATTDKGVRFVRRLGADAAVNDRKDDVAKVASRWCPEGVDALLAFAGGSALENALQAVKRGGRVAYPNGVDPAPKKRAGLKLSAYDAVSGKKEFERLNRVIEDEKPTIAIAASYPLERAVEAHERLDKGHILGKIVLRIRP